MSEAPARQDHVPLLEVEHLTMRFGGLIAVDDLSFTAYRREITAIIGPNGAGKTTVFNCLTGFYKPSAGRLALHADGAVLLLERMEGFRIARQAGTTECLPVKRYAILIGAKSENGESICATIGTGNEQHTRQ